MALRKSGRRTDSGGGQEECPAARCPKPNRGSRPSSHIASEEPLYCLVRLASEALGFPVAFLALFENDLLSIKASVGLNAVQLPHCHWTFLERLAEQPTLVVADFQKRCHKPCLEKARIDPRSCMAAGIRSLDGRLIGALCLLDKAARRPTKSHEQTL